LRTVYLTNLKNYICPDIVKIIFKPSSAFYLIFYSDFSHI